MCGDLRSLVNFYRVEKGHNNHLSVPRQILVERSRITPLLLPSRVEGSQSRLAEKGPSGPEGSGRETPFESK